VTYFQPILPFCILLLLLGLLAARRAAGKRLRLAWLGLALLFGVSWPPLNWLFSRALEAGYTAMLPPASTQALVIIASKAEFAHDDMPFDMLGHDTYRRCLRAVWLYRHWGQRPVLVSGNRIAAEMRRLLELEGIPPEHVLEEPLASNTYENALFSARILARHGITRIALIADARDLPRALACFRKAGLTVFPYPAASTGLGITVEDFMPDWAALESNEHTLHELVGLLWYRLRGWI
jgi:uncharacterized SAM-binding protein YcdF (DUF218 family)